MYILHSLGDGAELPIPSLWALRSDIFTKKNSVKRWGNDFTMVKPEKHYLK